MDNRIKEILEETKNIQPAEQAYYLQKEIMYWFSTTGNVKTDTRKR